MGNKVKLQIGGTEYHLLAEDSAEYMQQLGRSVDTKMSEFISASKAGRTDAAVLTALYFADELNKERKASEGIRAQLKQYLDEAAKAKNEAAELRRRLAQNQHR